MGEYLFNVDPNQIWIVITISRLIWHLTDFRLVVNLSETGEYDPNLLWMKRIQDKFLCRCTQNWVRFELWLHFSASFGSQRNSVSCQINLKIEFAIRIQSSGCRYITPARTWLRVVLTRFIYSMLPKHDNNRKTK